MGIGDWVKIRVRTTGSKKYKAGSKVVTVKIKAKNPAEPAQPAQPAATETPAATDNTQG